ncbi:hypothetical protein JDV02_003090 [Purpureocillium takamizusanense]|uniref:Uncharacterized protein n=1 Tax=Purpureocillium takamizusanense TaxID=2060973 RepID=A0A9Q8QCH2_9HYPO|nr:uncharacterized protein JDV02_003090 [Purpureocillium takamizusanense]UNI16676.1 hypothetical protein JDV02_003090 [Purpureocillium takamizusanense]
MDSPVAQPNGECWAEQLITPAPMPQGSQDRPPQPVQERMAHQDIVAPVCTTEPVTSLAAPHENRQELAHVPHQSAPPAMAPGHEAPRMMESDVEVAKDMRYRRRSPMTARSKRYQGVSRLTPAELNRKRANDREAKRVSRLRTQELISSLLRKVKTLKELRISDGETIRQLRHRNEALEMEYFSLSAATGFSYAPGAVLSQQCGNLAPDLTYCNSGLENWVQPY